MDYECNALPTELLWEVLDLNIKSHWRLLLLLDFFFFFGIIQESFNIVNFVWFVKIPTFGIGFS